MEYETRSRDLPWAGLLGGLALGALAMYIADPSQGRRRRALLQDKVHSVTNQTTHSVTEKLRDTRHRLAGLQAEAAHLLTPSQTKPIDDHVLEARVRAKLGRALSHLHQIQVSARAGQVTLAGAIAADEMSHLVQLVSEIPGVQSVLQRLHAQSDSVLQNLAGSAKQNRNWWTAGVLGASMLIWYGISRRAPLGLMAAASLGLFARSRTRTSSAQRQQSMSTASQHEATKTIVIDASPETVFDVWSNFENFPHFMSHVAEVRELGQQRSHWVIRGPGGVPVEWDAVLTASERPHRLAWETEAGSAMQQRGTVLLDAVEGGTQVTVHMAWEPPAGASGRLAGIDLGQMLEDDLQKMKQFIESGLPVREKPAAGKESGPIFH